METTFNSPIKYGSSHSTGDYLVGSPDSGVPQSSLHTPFSIQSESPLITSQPTTPSPLPRTSSIKPKIFQSTGTGTTPRSRNAGTLPLRNFHRECASGTGSHISKISPIYYYLSTSFSTNDKNLRKNSPSHSKQSLCYSPHLS